jgi:transposase
MPASARSSPPAATPARQPRRSAGRTRARSFFKLAEIAASPRTRSANRLEAVARIDAIFYTERTINGTAPDGRMAARRIRRRCTGRWPRSLDAERAGQLSRHAPVAKAMDYMLKRWPAFARFLEDGCICLANDAAERALSGVAFGREAWLFAGSDRGGDRQRSCTRWSEPPSSTTSTAGVLGNIAQTPASRLDELLPWCQRGATGP